MAMSHRFADRTEAGRELATAIRDRDIDPDIVLAIPRGALPLGRVIADAFDVPLDIVVASKIGAPGNPELAIGAVSSDGSVWRNTEAYAATRADEEYFERARKQEAKNAREKAERYRGTRDPPSLAEKTVVVVDDGVATGSTARACLKQLQDESTNRIVLAIPVGPPGTVQELEELVDDLVCLQTPAHFQSVGQFYDRFDQVSDELAMSYLENDNVS